jgi:DNA mismatch endonuclease (patch repair protein)
MDRSENMRAIRGKDTKPELLVRSLIHSLGFRFRLHWEGLPGRPDIVLPGLRKVVFVHGCFWHLHACKNGLIPNSNRAFWLPKLKSNSARDERNVRDLRKLGWRVLVIWQCQLKNEAVLKKRLLRFLGNRG